MQGSLFGGANPLYDIPMILSLWHEGHIKLTELITKRYTLDEINEGYARPYGWQEHPRRRRAPALRYQRTREQGKERSEHHAERDPRPHGDRHHQRRQAGGTAGTAAPPACRRKRVGLLINTKQNARPFLEEVGRLLEDQYGVTLTKRTKVNFAVPEPEEVIKELAADQRRGHHRRG